jgi:hypothetical protein
MQGEHSMTTAAQAHVQLNRAVVAFLDGRRQRGFIYDFSAVKESFRLSPESDTLQQRGVEIKVKDLKAVFFVKDFAGNREYVESAVTGNSPRGRKMAISFTDGETLQGCTDAYNPKRPGFFLFPTDAKSNNLRIFYCESKHRPC